MNTRRHGGIATSRRVLAAFSSAAIVSCGEGPGPETGAVVSDAPRRVADSTRPLYSPTPEILTGNRVAGIEFDPLAVRAGDRIGSLMLNSIEVRVAYDSTRVGTARFSGHVELSGWTKRHPEADLRDVDLCFEADSTSAARLPRWRGDGRRAWFCFENQTEAKQMLGPPSDSTPATVIVDRFNLRRGLTDEVNSARLVRVRGQ